MAESTPVPRVTEFEAQYGRFFGVTVFSMALGVVIMVIRIFQKMRKKKLSWDDLLAFLSMASLLTQGSLNFSMLNFVSLGYIADVSSEAFRQLWERFLYSQIAYRISLSSSHMAILYLYFHSLFENPVTTSLWSYCMTWAAVITDLTHSFMRILLAAAQISYSSPYNFTYVRRTLMVSTFFNLVVDSMISLIPFGHVPELSGGRWALSKLYLAAILAPMLSISSLIYMARADGSDNQLMVGSVSVLSSADLAIATLISGMCTLSSFLAHCCKKMLKFLCLAFRGRQESNVERRESEQQERREADNSAHRRRYPGGRDVHPIPNDSDGDDDGNGGGDANLGQEGIRLVELPSQRERTDASSIEGATPVEPKKFL